MVSLIFPQGADATACSRRYRAGELGRLRKGIYYDDPKASSATLRNLVQSNWHQVVANVLGDHAVAAYRTAVELKPVDGKVFIAAPVAGRRQLRIDDYLEIEVIPGNGDLGTVPFCGIRMSAEARQLLENLTIARPRDGVPRSLGTGWVENKLCKLFSHGGELALNRVRDEAKALAEPLGLMREYQKLTQIISALLSSRPAESVLTSDIAKATARGEPYDPARIALFQGLSHYLEHCPFPSVPYRFSRSGWQALAFMESYFSNYIEGTRFTIDEAEAIVFDQKAPEGRPQDSHDVLAVYRLASDLKDMNTSPATAQELMDLLQERHAFMMSQRPEVNPGQFKQRQNQAGDTLFVSPRELEGTLTRGFEYMDRLPPGLARAIYISFLIAECHPFDDGNGRVCRLFANAELVVSDQHKLFVPSAYRDSYVSALRRATREGDFRTMARSLYLMQAYTASLPWEDYNLVKQSLSDDSAFMDTDEGLMRFNRALARFSFNPPASVDALSMPDAPDSATPRGEDKPQH